MVKHKLTDYLDKEITICLKSRKKYFGKLVEVDSTSSNILTWITIVDKSKKRLTFCTSEIDWVKEEEEK